MKSAQVVIIALMFSALLNAATLTIALGDWGYPNPFTFYPRGPGYVITSFIFDTLVWKDPHGVIPWLASSWEHPALDVWVFHLRKNLKWSDGEPLTAEDVAFTFNYLKEHHWKWKSLNVIKTVRILNETTVMVILKRPVPLFLQDYASTVFIVPKHVWSHVKDPYTYTEPDSFVGSGPYELVSYKPGTGYTLRVNPFFWGPKPIYDKIKITALGFSNPQRAVLALVQGKVDTVTLMGKAWRLILMAKRASKNLSVLKGPMYWVLFLGFNLNKYPYSNAEFRRAIAYSLDLKELVMRSVGSLEAAIPGTPSYVPPYSEFYNPHVPAYPYNIAEAKLLLDKLSIKDINGDGCRELQGRPWRPLLVTSKGFLQEALVIRSMLKRVGICINVKVVPSFKQLDAIIRSGSFDMEINGHGADGNDPLALTWVFKAFGTPWNDPEYRRLVNEMLNATSLSEVYKCADEIQYLVARELPRIALYYPYEFVLVRPGVKVKWFFTYEGIDGGIPLPYNKLALLR